MKFANRFEIVEIPVANLVGWAKNPREVIDQDYLVEVLENRGQLVPLLVDGRDMKTVLGGNMRLHAMSSMKWEKAVCVICHPVDDRDAVLLALENNNQFGRYLKEPTIELLQEFDISESKIRVDLYPIPVTDLLPIEPDYPDTGATGESKDKPATITITFPDTATLETFKEKLDTLVTQFEGVDYKINANEF